MDPRSLPVARRVQILVRALDGAKKTNEALAACRTGDELVAVLLNASARLGLALSRDDLMRTPPIRDWIWWKGNSALLTIGDDRPRYQQDRLAPPQPAKDDAAAGETPRRRRFLGLF
ncbi:hypothetical protein EVJ50_01755 [Synechococcus sp. RSCCF101]|nr:hypothetical protein EVJ50_01755 [Synechococcus sp. RSCCF101]